MCRPVSTFPSFSNLKIYEILLAIVTLIWQKLIIVEREVLLIVTDFWQLLSRIFGETLLIITNI